jgi:hypothetical protein
MFFASNVHPTVEATAKTALFAGAQQTVREP